MNSIRQSRWLIHLAPLLLIGCSDAKLAGGRDTAGYAESVPTADASAEFLTGSDEVAVAEEAAAAELSLDRKIVYTASVEIVIEDFDVLEGDLKKLIDQYKGHISNSNTHVAHRDRREGRWTIRVPVENFDAFLEDAKKLGELRSSGIDSQDRTEEYYDVQAALKNKRRTLERFEKLADRNESDLKHIRDVEKDIERVQGEIDRLTGRIKLLNDLTSLTTVTLNAVEIKDYVPPEAPTLGTEISRSFSNSVSSLAFAGREVIIFTIAAAPWLPVLLIVVVILRYLIRFVWRRLRRNSN
ncbi:MAG: DUF4349 domain-containing protein [Pirellulales bacterium]